VFRYAATVRAFVGSDDEPLEEKTVIIKRDWI
jgi:hypothetical protein